MYFNYTTCWPHNWWERRSFLRAWWRLYADDRQWAPPAYAAFSRVIGSGSHPLYARLAAQPLYLEALPRRGGSANFNPTAPVAAAVAFVRFGVRDVDDLSLLRGRAPWTAAGVTVACISLIGIPPLCGFFGKWYILLGALEARQWLVATFVVASSVITAIYVFRILEQLFLFTHKNEPKQDPGPEPREGSFALIAACSLLGIGIVVFGMMTSRVVTEVVAPLLTAGVQ